MITAFAAIFVAILLAACSGGSGGQSGNGTPGGGTATYTVGGTVTGLVGQGLVLRNNGADDISVTGAFAFPSALLNGASYDVTVSAHPTNPVQTCSVANGSGVINASNVTNVVVDCVRVTSQGTDFWLTFPDHACVSAPASCAPDDSVAVKLIISAVAATSGTVIVNGVTTPFTVANAGQSVITLDPGVVLTSNETVESKGARVTAQLPVSVYAVIENRHSADGYLALPTATLGTRYYAVSRASPTIPGSQFALVATQNNTAITVVPSAAGATRPAGVPFTVTLNAGETYQFQNTATGDVSGSLIVADNAIAVFSGHRCAQVPGTAGSCDYLVEQLPDTTRLGRTFYSMPFAGRSRYTVRIVATVDGTTCALTPSVATCPTLDAGRPFEFETDTPIALALNHPALVAQFMHSNQDETDPSRQQGDPSMVMVAPMEQGVSEAPFAVHGLAGTSGPMLNVITLTAVLADLTLDGAPVDTGVFSVIGTSGFSAGSLVVAPGTHLLRGSSPFNAYVYDYGTPADSVSYAYPVAHGVVVANPAAAGATVYQIVGSVVQLENIR